MRRFPVSSDMDLRFYFAEAAGELGVRSGFEAFVALMMTGASKDGGTIAQPTSAQVDRVWAGRETPRLRQIRVRGVLAGVPEPHLSVLRAYYSPARSQNMKARRRSYHDDSPNAPYAPDAEVTVRNGKVVVGLTMAAASRIRDHGDPVLDLLSPLETEFGDLAPVVLLRHARTAMQAFADLHAVPVPAAPDRASQAAAKAEANARRAAAKAEIKSIRAQCEMSLRRARDAYQDVIDIRRTPKRHRPRVDEMRALADEVIGGGEALPAAEHGQGGGPDGLRGRATGGDGPAVPARAGSPGRAVPDSPWLGDEADVLCDAASAAPALSRVLRQARRGRNSVDFSGGAAERRNRRASSQG